jgi:hypothetical protein
MTDDLKPGLGTTFSITSALPADELLATYEALTGWAVVGEVTDIPTFGPAHDVVTHVPLATGITAKYHGALNNGSLTIPMAMDYNDAGQLALKGALSDRDRFAFRVSYADGTNDYFQGKVMSFTRGASIGSVVTAEVMIEVETKIVEDLTPTP